MATVIESLLMEIGVDVDEKSLKSFNNVTEGAVKKLKRVAVVAGATGAAVVAYTVALARSTDENAKFADQTGVSYQAMQELGFAAEREGANMDSLKSSLGGLTRVAGEAYMGMGTGIEAFARLGINIRDVNGDIKTADTLINEVSGSMQGMSKAEQTDLIGKLGISQDMLLLLQKGTGNLATLRKEARKYGVESARMAKSGQDFQDNMTNLKASIFGALIPLRQFALDLANNLLPKISDWIAENRKLIKSKFVEYMKKAVKYSASLAKSLKKAMPFIEGLVAGFVAFKALSIAKNIFMAGKAIWALVPAITGATGGLSLIIPVIAAVVGALAMWFRNSEQGSEVFKYAMKQIGDAVDRVKSAVVNAFNSMGLSVNDFSDVWEKYLKPAFEWLMTGAVIVAVEAIVSVINMLAYEFELVGNAIDMAVSGVKTLMKWFENLANSEAVKKVGDIISSTVGTAKSFGARVSQEAGFVSDFLFGKDKSPTPKASTQSSTTNNNKSINANIEISSASGDPIAMGQAVKDALNSVARNGLENQTVAVKI